MSWVQFTRTAGVVRKIRVEVDNRTAARARPYDRRPDGKANKKPAPVAQGGFSEFPPPYSVASASFSVLLGRIAAEVLAKSGT